MIVLAILIREMGIAQEITGVVTDSLQMPISNATVILQSEDSIFIHAVITREDGRFMIPATKPAGKRLLFQHLLYEPLEYRLEPGKTDVGQVILREKQHVLEGVTVKASQPILQVKGNVLSYTVAPILEQKAVSDAFEVIRKIPGVIGNDEEIRLVGAQQVTVVVNGQVSTLTQEQLYKMLHSIPAAQVKNVEVMYNAPAKYNIRGAVINVVTDRTISEKEKWMGEVAATYLQSEYALGTARGNVAYRGKKASLDMMADWGKGKEWNRTVEISRHTFQNQIYRIENDRKLTSDHDLFAFRLAGDYRLRPDHRFTFSYYFDGKNSDNDIDTENQYEGLTRYRIDSRNFKELRNQLQNAHVEYNGKDRVKVGVDYTFYKDKEDDCYLDYQAQERVSDFLNHSSQEIQRWNLTANYDHPFSARWTGSIGANGGYYISDSYVDYWFPEEGETGAYQEDLSKRLDSRQKEYTGTFYIETNYRSNEHFSFQLSLQAEYFNAKYDQNKFKMTLWDEWAFFPNLTLMYLWKNQDMLQFTFSSNKSYPSYWAVSPQTTHVNAYTEVTGNPYLKPCRQYDANLMYVLKQKYTFMAFATYVSERFAQMPYQDEEHLKIVHRFENFDHDLTTGIAAIIPLQVGHCWNTNFTLYGIRLQQKINDFHGSRIHKEKYSAVLFWNNSFLLLPHRSDLILEINGHYQAPSIQGVYDLGHMCSLYAGLKWKFLPHAYLKLDYKNILRNNMPDPIVIDWGNQYNRRRTYEKSTVALTLSWQFGDYKAKKYHETDRSRLGR